MILRTIGFRLALFVGLLVAVALLLHFALSMSHHESALVKLKREEASLLADTIKRSLNRSMLQGREGRVAIHRVIQDVSAREEIERVRIFNGVGLIQYSSDASEMGRVVDKDAENCRQCHQTEVPLRPESITDTSRFFYTPATDREVAHRVMGVISPIRIDEDESCATCHEGQTVLGVLDVVVSLASLDADVRQHRRSLVLFGLLAVGLTIAAVALVTHLLVGRPVKGLVEGTERVGRLDLDHRLPADRRDELGVLARAFNEMTGRLQEARAEIREFTDSLEHKVEEKTEQLQSAQLQMLRAEKMAAIGQMAAGVAHEINNPLTGVITFATLLKRKMPESSQQREDIDTIITEAMRCARIARGLLDFARGGELDRKRVNVNEVLERTLSLVERQANFHNIRITRDFESDPPSVEIDVDRMEQVFLNLVMNAAEAMPDGGWLILTTRCERPEDGTPTTIRIVVEDTGAGIPEEIRNRIFEPFFTTKEPGEGTGLGLAVSYGIVVDHGGRITASSESAVGSRFSVVLPVAEEGR